MYLRRETHNTTTATQHLDIEHNHILKILKWNTSFGSKMLSTEVIRGEEDYV